MTGRAQTQTPSSATTDDRAQIVSATLTVEVKDADAVSRAAQSALDLTRSLGGFVVSSSVATGEEGSASITVRVPVDKVQDAIAGLSDLGRLVSQQVTIDDLQQNLDELTRRESSVRTQIAPDPRAPRVGIARRADRGGAAGTSADPAHGARLDPPGARRHQHGSADVHHPAHRRARPARSAPWPRRRRIDRAIDEALNVLAWEGVVALGLAIVLAPFALVGLAAWLGRRVYRRHEEERLLAA